MFSFKNTFKEEVGMTNSLDLDQTRLAVRPDPGTNCLQNINTRTYFVCLSMQLKCIKHIHITD